MPTQRGTNIGVFKLPPRGVRPQVISCLQDPQARSRLQIAFEGLVIEDASPSTLLEAIDSASLKTLGTVVVVGIQAIERLGPSLANMRIRHPHTALLGWIPPNETRRAFELGQAGFDVLVMQGIDDQPAGVRRRTEQALSRILLGSIVEDLVSHVPPLSRGMVHSAFMQLNHVKTTLALASSLGMTLQALRCALRKVRLPPPQRLMAWCRLLLASRLLEERGRSAESVAFFLDYSSAPAFQNACRRLLHVTPGDVRRAGGFSFAIAQFEGELALTS